LDASGAPIERDVGQRNGRTAAPVVAGRGRERQHCANIGSQAANELRIV